MLKIGCRGRFIMSSPFRKSATNGKSHSNGKSDSNGKADLKGQSCDGRILNGETRVLKCRVHLKANPCSNRYLLRMCGDVETNPGPALDTESLDGLDGREGSDSDEDRSHRLDDQLTEMRKKKRRLGQMRIWMRR